MTRNEFNAWRDRLYLSHRSAAEALGISARQIAYYAKGEKSIPLYIALACEALELRQAIEALEKAHQALVQALETAAQARSGSLNDGGQFREHGAP